MHAGYAAVPTARLSGLNLRLSPYRVQELPIGPYSDGFPIAV